MVGYRNMTPPKPGCWERYKNKRNSLFAFKRLCEMRRGKKSVPCDSDAVPSGDLTEQKLELERPPSGSIDVGIEDKPGLENAPLDVGIEWNPTLESLPLDSVNVGIDKAGFKGSPFDRQGSPSYAPTVYVGNLEPEGEPSVVEGGDSHDKFTSIEKEATVTKRAEVKALDKKRKSVVLSPGHLKKKKNKNKNKNEVGLKSDEFVALMERVVLGPMESAINGAIESLQKGEMESVVKGAMASAMQTPRGEVKSYMSKEKIASIILSSSSDEEFST